MSDATVQGTVHLIEETKTYGQKGFRKRLVVLEQDKGRFINYIPLEFVHEDCDRADERSVGDDVQVTYRLSGRRWQRDERSEVKFFLNAEATDFKILQKAGQNDDGPPEAWFSPLKGDDVEFPLMDYYKTRVLSRGDVDGILDDYYDERGWDRKTGAPTAERLAQLGLPTS